MKEATYFVSYVWKDAEWEMQNIVNFGNASTEKFPLIWLKEMRDSHPNKIINLLWWKQLTDKDEIEAANTIGQTAI